MATKNWFKGCGRGMQYIYQLEETRVILDETTIVIRHHEYENTILGGTSIRMIVTHTKTGSWLYSSYQ